MLAGEVLDRIPTEPGVYLFKDARGGVIYVGKAKNLRTRVRLPLPGRCEPLADDSTGGST